ncbi:carbon-nitrogen hydrolase, partial [Escherichia coli]
RVGSSDNLALRVNHPAVTAIMAAVAIAADAHQATRIDAELSMVALREYREKFPAWQDADEFRLR